MQIILMLKKKLSLPPGEFQNRAREALVEIVAVVHRFGCDHDLHS